ncbi:P-loop containing nucleoside triphosphate hydrolase protein [Rickenella mellea]|uniref:P-loop containing nucleoside triphosphate hydrolase protein n=1 Tax=Rickenella mellea TaxID=50990 RepID=A0A4Y7Q166_9AGAM|nr:P-loop containing nucleoside triphosphate hydrolase protein [Rickenella mellea]
MRSPLVANIEMLRLINAWTRDRFQFIPPALAVLSFSFLLIKVLAGLYRALNKTTATNGHGDIVTENGLDENSHSLDGPIIFCFRVLNLLSVLALLSLSIYLVAVDEDVHVLIALVAFYIYVSMLAGCAIFLSPRWRDTSHIHASLLLLGALLVYAYLDVWPLASTDHSDPEIPRDWLIWMRIGLLTLSGAVIPLISPRPFRPQHPDDLPNPEYTCSLLSNLTCSYLDSVIFYAYRVSDITMKDLPPLPRKESAKYIDDKNASKIDPVLVGTKRHVFWGICRVFAKNYARIFLCVLCYSFTVILIPLGIKNLLSYLENGRPQVGFRPWVWVTSVTLGPLILALLNNQYFLESAIIVTEADTLLTQLVFDHSLRIRMKSDLLEDRRKSYKGDGKKALTSDHTSSATTPASVEEETRVEDTVSGAQIPAGTHTPVESSETPKMETDSSVMDKTEGEEKAKVNGAQLTGKINNLLTTDLNQIKYTQDVLRIPGTLIQVVVAMVFLYSIIGWSSFVGMGIIVVCLPLPTYVSKLVMQAQKRKMEKTDARIQAVTEAMNVLRMIKLFAWEIKILDQITKNRETELRWVRYGKLLDYLGLHNSNSIIPIVSMICTFGTYTLIMKKPLTASVAFSAISVFNIITRQMYLIVWQLPEALRLKVSMDRFNEFFNETELLDNSSATNKVSAFSAPSPSPDVIGFNAGTFSWTDINKSQSTKSAMRIFRLHFDGEVMFRRGGINLIIGPTASGKTSLLMALLGEMYCKPHGPGSWYNLPRDGGIAYAAQESWVLNETVKENILFGEPYDQQRYQKVLKQCALERDLGLWEAGDQTEVGEKGLTLSGGQKARVTLARALYSRAEILLLDDVLAALDVHTAKWVVDKALKGDIVAGRTVLLVTHNVALTSSIADFVITLGKNGRVADHGSISDILQNDAKLRAAFEKEKALTEKIDVYEEGKDDEEVKKSAGKLVVPEEKQMGRVERAALMLFFQGFGNGVFWFITLFSKILTTVLQIARPVWIAYWSSQYASGMQVPALRYLGMYSLIQLAQIVFDSLGLFLWVVGTIRASRIVHYKLIQSIFNAPLRWLDTVPIGRVIIRCTQDIDALDNSFSGTAINFLEVSISVIGNFFVSIYMAGWPALLSGGIMVALGGWLGMVYLKAQLCIRREMSNAKSPVMSQVAQTLAGLPSIRAYGAEGRFRSVLRNRQDVYTRAALTFFTINRWINIRADCLGTMFSSVVTVYLVYFTTTRAGSVGLTLTVVTAFAQEILWWVRLYNLTEIQSNSLERILDFLRIEHEPAPVESGKPPAYWPSSGSLRAEGLSARYSDDGPEVLQDLHFDIASGERVGIVGRTGAGKSSLALALLRTIQTTGTVHFDGLPMHSINLDALRSSVTLIPQQPELLSGTLRENLDPFKQYDDATLNDALRSAGLFQLQDERKPAVAGSSSAAADAEEGSALGLDTQVDAGGSNFSLGQRQIIALARAIVRQSKLLILDEATAAIDYETDTAIQTSLRTELSKDTTVITIAHRLQTIMDSDKIMVLEAGRLVEFDTPKNLFQKDTGLLRALVDESADSARLREIAGIQE